jgi:hypothetical protein
MNEFPIKAHADKVRVFMSDFGRAENLRHMLIGMVTETGEILDAYKRQLYYGKELDLVNLKEEIGDVLFYASIAADILNSGSVFYGKSTTRSSPLTLTINLCRISSEMLRFAQVNFSFDENQRAVGLTREAEISLKTWLDFLVIELDQFSAAVGITIQEASDTNFAKLNKRYKDGKFNADHAINRDTEAERKVLEQPSLTAAAKPKKVSKKTVPENQMALSLEPTQQQGS